MNKNDLVKAIAEKVDLTQKDITAVVDELFSATTKSLRSGEEVSIAGFGKFVAKSRAARQSINPRTKEVVDVPACVVPAFKAGKALKEAVNTK